MSNGVSLPKYFAVCAAGRPGAYYIYENRLVEAINEWEQGLILNCFAALNDLDVLWDFRYQPEMTGWQEIHASWPGQVISGRMRFVGTQLEVNGIPGVSGVSVVEMNQPVVAGATRYNTNFVRNSSDSFGRRYPDLPAGGPRVAALPIAVPIAATPRGAAALPVAPPVAPAALSGTLPVHIQRLVIADAISKGEVCPISQETLTMENAVVTSCGHVFERDSIQAWLKTAASKHCCAVCREKCCV